MADESRVPVIIAEFNSYINNTDDYQLAGSPTINMLRLGCTGQNSSDWKAKRTAWVVLYKKYIDPTQSTSAVTRHTIICMSCSPSRR